MNNESIFFNSIIKAHKNNPDLMQEGVADFALDDNFNDYYKVIIFHHKFAKAFWGEKKKCECSGFGLQYQGCVCDSVVSGWQYHLQQMILEEEPLKYLEKFLDSEKCIDVLED